MTVLGIDAGAGTKSATGLAFLNTQDFSIDTEALWPDKRSAPFLTRLRNLTNKYDDALIGQEYPGLVIVESFVMRAKGGESLQRLIGAYLSIFPEEIPIIEVANTLIKQYIGGSGKSDKEEVARGVINWFQNKNADSVIYIKSLLEQERWDEIDAIAIAISGYLLNEEK